MTDTIVLNRADDANFGPSADHDDANFGPVIVLNRSTEPPERPAIRSYSVGSEIILNRSEKDRD